MKLQNTYRGTSALRGVLFVLVALFLANWAAGAFVDPLPEAYLSERAATLSGWSAEDLTVQSGGYDGNWISRTAHLELRAADETIYIEASRLINFAPWRVAEYRVERRP